MSANETASETIVRRLWQRARPRLDANERMEVQDWRGVIADSFDGWRVHGGYFRVDRNGDMLRHTYRGAFVDIEARELSWRGPPGALIDVVIGALRYLAALLRPRRPPKGWRLFGRRPQ